MTRVVGFLRNSVRGRLACLVIATTVPAALLVALLVLQAYRDERETVGQHVFATARAMSDVVDYQLGASEALLRGLAASRDLDLGDIASFDAHARTAFDNESRWVVLADGEGQQLVNTRLPPGAKLPRHAFDGAFAEAMRAGRSYFSNIVTGPVTGRPVLYVAVPVTRAGQLKYTLSVALLPEVFDDVVKPPQLLPGTVLAVVDREGTVAARNPNGEKFRGKQATGDMLKRISTRSAGLMPSVTLEGVPVLSALSLSPVSGWGVIIGSPDSSIYASAQRLLWIGLGATGLLLTVALFMTVWIGRALVSGVDSLVADTETIGRGGVPAERSSGLLETDFVAAAMLKTARQLNQREHDNAALNVALQSELEKSKRGEATSRRLAAIVESSDDAIISTDLAGVITSWNKGAEQTFGYTAPEIIGRPVTALIPPDRLDEEPRILERIRTGEILEHYETLRRRKDGTLLSISLSVSPLRNHAGEIVGASKIARDVTQRVRAEAQQHALYELVATVNRAGAMEEIFDAALTAMCRNQDTERAAILLTDESGVMRFKAARGLSPAYCRAVEGHSPWRSDETNPQVIWIEDVSKASLAPELRAAIESEGIRALAFVPLTYEQRLLGKVMIYFPTTHVFTTAAMLPVETIASQVAFAIERRKSAEALEALVDERTASLRQVVAQMEEFSYSVSHDLRAPVRAMRGFAEIIQQDHADGLSPTGRDLLGRIVRNSERMDRLIQDLLTYSRISRREIQLGPVSLDKLLREVVQQYPDLRPERADIEVQGPLPEVLAHEPSLTQVISNLLSNAVKFVEPQARPRVRIGFDRRATQARLWFEDNGIGIKPEHQKRLFAMFERVHPDRNYEGTGIGLAIVRKAVERMNGAVGVESDGVRGSRFWFELPMAGE